MKPTLQQLNQYTDYLMKEEACAFLKTELGNIKQQAIDDPETFEEYDDNMALVDLDINSFVYFEVKGYHESNDEGGSYFSLSSIKVQFPEIDLTFSWHNAEWLMDNMGNYSSLFDECERVDNNPVEPFKMEVVA